MAKPSDALPQLKPLTLAGLLKEIQDQKKAITDAEIAQKGYRITLANDISIEVSQFCASNNIIIGNEAVNENVYQFDCRSQRALIKALNTDEFETSSDGNAFTPGNRRAALAFILRMLGFHV